MESKAEQGVKKSLFGTAKVVEKKTAAKDEKQTVLLLESQYPGISQKLKDLAETREKLADLEAHGKMIEGVIKEIGRDKFAELYAQHKSNPGSFLLKGEDGGVMMCIVMDKYLTIDGARAEELKKNFGGDSVTLKTEYKFNAELLEKYEEVLSDLIMGSDKIAEEDKPNLILQEPKWSVAKGIINRIVQIAGTESKMIGAVVSALGPVIQLKNSRG